MTMTERETAQGGNQQQKENLHGDSCLRQNRKMNKNKSKSLNNCLPV